MKNILLGLAFLGSSVAIIDANAESIESHQVVSSNQDYSEVELNQKVEFQPVELNIELSPELDELGKIKAFRVKLAKPKKVDMPKTTTTF